MAYDVCKTCKDFAYLRKSGKCYKCDPSKSSFRPKTGVIPGADKVVLQNVFSDVTMKTTFETMTAAGASTRDIIKWFRNGDYSRKITHADIQRILDGKFPRLPKKRKELRLCPYILAEPCECGELHLHEHDEIAYPKYMKVYDPAVQVVKTAPKPRKPKQPRNYEGKVWLY